MNIYYRRFLTTFERFEDSYREDGNGCWVWTGPRRRNEHGRFYDGNKTVFAHRWSYEWYRGPIPDGLTIDHLCRNPPCVNPAHLEAVTMEENLRRGFGVPAKNTRKTHCKYGHPLSGGNVFCPRGAKGRKWRVCLTCKRLWDRLYYLPREERANAKLALFGRKTA